VSISPMRAPLSTASADRSRFARDREHVVNAPSFKRIAADTVASLARHACAPMARRRTPGHAGRQAHAVKLTDQPVNLTDLDGQIDRLDLWRGWSPRR
jgi:hypothetical protein